jgi:hypothetical protein
MVVQLLRSNLPVFALPFPLLRHLQLRRAQFYGLLLTFALGAITIAVSLGRFISTEELECSLHLVYDTDDCCNHSRLAPSSQIAS